MSLRLVGTAGAALLALGFLGLFGQLVWDLNHVEDASLLRTIPHLAITGGTGLFVLVIAVAFWNENAPKEPTES